MSERFQQRNELVSTDMDGETVTMSLHEGEYFGLGGVGGMVWAMLANPVTAAELCARITTEFDVSTATCERDIAAFLTELLDNNLIRRC